MLFYLFESSLNNFNQLLLEKKTQEQYSRESFKKKYNFKPDKPGADTGTITKDGKTYRIDMKKDKIINYNNEKVLRNLSADSESEKSTIYLDDKFFKLKGSNKGERKDALLNHEIGHQNLHNINSNNKTVDKKNRTEKVFKTVIDNELKDKNIKYDPIIKHLYYKNKGIDNYNKSGTSNAYEKQQRDKSLEIAKKYEKDEPHYNAIEYEADRYAVNKTSEKSLKRGLRNYHKLSNSNKAIKQYKKITKNNIPIEHIKKVENKYFNDEFKNRTKVLKDKDMKKSDIYK